MRTTLFPVVLCVCLALAPIPSDARSYLMPYLSETPGVVGVDKKAADTKLAFAYTPTVLGNSGAPPITIDVYLFEQDGANLALSESGLPVCGPCSFTLDDKVRRKVLTLETLILDAGGFKDRGFEGYAVITVSSDEANVSMVNFVVNSITGPLQVSVFGSEPKEITAPAIP